MVYGIWIIFYIEVSPYLLCDMVLEMKIQNQKSSAAATPPHEVKDWEYETYQFIQCKHGKILNLKQILPSIAIKHRSLQKFYQFTIQLSQLSLATR